MISYAQNYEDVILERFFKDKNDGFYVDIGAADPVMHSVTKHFYDKGWHGINIEPSPVLFKKLQESRLKDTNLEVAVSTEEGVLTFYDIPNSGLSTTVVENAAAVEANEQQGNYDGEKVDKPVPLNVKSQRLESILSEHCSEYEIDFLKIDVEGAEKEVLLSNNWNKYRPKILIIEATIPNSQKTNHENWEYLVIEAGYEFVYFDGLNRFYLREDLIEYKDLFSVPPCVFDDYTKHSEVELREKNHSLWLENTALQSQHNALQSQHNALQSQHNALQSQHNNLDLRYNSLVNSYSWKITAPLRWGLNIAKKVFNKIKKITKALVLLPRKVLRSGIILTGSFILKIEFISRPLKKILKKYPGLYYKLFSIIKNRNQILLESQYVNDAGLSPGARRIYEDLKREIEEKKKG